MRSLYSGDGPFLPGDSLVLPEAYPSFVEYDESNGFWQVYKVEELLDEATSQWQHIQVYKTIHFGNVLVIDNALMITQRDEFHYHEMIAHVPLAYLPEAKKVVVIGGGDGGTVMQCLKHPNIEQLTHVELDAEVLRLSTKWFPMLAAGYADPRYKGMVSDGAAWVKSAAAAGDKQDLILVDSTDFNAAMPLFTEAFYTTVRDSLNPGGIFVFNIDSPSWHLNAISVVSNMMRELFKYVFLYQVYQPTYTSGHYSYIFCSQTVHPLDTKIDWQAFKRKTLQLDYYSPQVHMGAFALPGFVKQVLPSADSSLEKIPSWEETPQESADKQVIETGTVVPDSPLEAGVDPQTRA